jgi:opacity protein-like surface antigen
VLGLVVGVAVVASTGDRAAAQSASRSEVLKPVVGWGGLSLIVGVPTGEFQDYIDAGFGGDASFVLPVKHDSPLALRADLGFLVYGSETKRVCFSQTVGCRIELDLTTTNSILQGTIGPQLMLPTGAVRPYVHAGIGFGYFATTSSVDGTNDNEDFASTRNFSDATFQWTGGGGLLVRLSSGKTPVLLDLGARYNANGSVEYLKEGDIHDQPDGSITFTPTRSDANLLTFNIGVVIGIRPGSN